MKLYRLNWVVLVILCTGCNSFWPKYEKPNVITPQKWSSKDPKTKITHSNLSNVAWWKSFHDPELNQLMAEALIKNNSLHVAFGNITQARASLQKVQAGWLPTLGLGGTGFKGKVTDLTVDNPTGESLFSRLERRSSWPYNGYANGFVPDYTINILVKLKQVEISKLKGEVVKQMAYASRLTIISQMAASYLTLIGLKKQLHYQYCMLNDLKELKKYIIIQCHQGASSEMNIVSIDQHIATLKKFIPTIKNSITHAENAIDLLRNKNPGPFVTHTDFDQLSADGIIPVNLPADMMKYRPDIAIAEYELQITNATIAEAAAQIFPSINLAGFIGNAGFSLTNLVGTFGNILQGQISAAIPVIDFGILADIKQAKASKYSALYNYLQTVRRAFSQVDDGISQHNTVNQSYQDQLTALNKAALQYRLAKKQYEQGALSYAATLTYKLNVDYMKAVLNKYKMQQMGSIVELYMLLGGGATARINKPCVARCVQGMKA